MGQTDSKYPPAEPGALVSEPLKAAYPCRSSQASLYSVNASPSAEPLHLGKLRYLLFATCTWYALISIIIREPPRESRFRPPSTQSKHHGEDAVDKRAISRREFGLAVGA